MDGKSTIMKVKNPMDSKLRNLKRQKRKCNTDLQDGHDQYAFYNMDNFPFRATKTSDLYF